MFKLDNDFLTSLGLGSLPVDEKNKLLQHIYERLEMNVGMRLAEKMTDAQLDEFESFIDRNDEAGALRWLETNFPNYKQVVADELEKLKTEVSQAAPQILAAAQNAPVTPMPPQEAPQQHQQFSAPPPTAPDSYQQPVPMSAPQPTPNMTAPDLQTNAPQPWPPVKQAVPQPQQPNPGFTPSPEPYQPPQPSPPSGQPTPPIAPQPWPPVENQPPTQPQQFTPPPTDWQQQQ